MGVPAGFLRDARGRLLPASIPFRFFGAATVFHLLAWAALVPGALATPGFAGGLGLPLAALHLVTLGVLAMTALGASLQLLPVATRQPVASPRAAAALGWVYLAGVAATTLGMALAAPALLAAGAAATVGALAAYAALLARNLRGARGVPVVTAHGWAAWVSLGLALASALALAAAWLGHPVLARPAAVGLHIAFAAYGFMGLLVLGFSHILVPMFALSDAPPRGPSLASAGAAIAALALSALGSLGIAEAWLAPLAPAVGLLALGSHVVLMERARASGMRPRLGRSFVLVRVGWAGLGASLAVALAMALGLGVPRAPALFGALLAGGLLSLLLGMLSRIVPFLAAMHSTPGRRGPPLPSALTAERPLKLHFGCHLGAFALLLAAIALDSAALVAAAGAVGTVGAAAFGAFFAVACHKMRR